MRMREFAECGELARQMTLNCLIAGKQKTHQFQMTFHNRTQELFISSSFRPHYRHFILNQ